MYRHVPYIESDVWSCVHRNVYERANREVKTAEDKEERFMLLESWKQFEVSCLLSLPSSVVIQDETWNKYEHKFL